MDKAVSVILVARNEEKYIQKAIMSLLQGTSSAILFEIIVVDGLSTDNTLQIVNKLSKEYPSVKHLSNTAQITPAGLNLGVKMATYPYVLIAGAHTTYPANYIETLFNAMDYLKADGVGGQLTTEVLCKSKKSNAIASVLSHPLGVGNSRFRTGVAKPQLVDTVPFGLYKKHIFDEVGYYNEKLIRNHDMEWSKRLSAADKKIYLIPEVTCTYYARETFSALARNNMLNGLWNILAVILTRRFSSLSIRHFIPFIFVTSLLICLLLSFFCFWFFLLHLLILIAYLLAVSVVSFRLKKQDNSIIFLVFAFFTLHFSYGFGSMLGLFKGLFLKKLS